MSSKVPIQVSRTTQANPALAKHCMRRNFAQDFVNPSEDQSSSEDSVELLSEEETCGKEYTNYCEEAERLRVYRKSNCWIAFVGSALNYCGPRFRHFVFSFSFFHFQFFFHFHSRLCQHNQMQPSHIPDCPIPKW